MKPMIWARARAKYFSEARNIVTVLSVPMAGLIYTRVVSESLLVLKFPLKKSTQHSESIQHFRLKQKRASVHAKTKTQPHWQCLVLSVAVCDTFCTVHRTVRRFLRNWKSNSELRQTRVKRHLTSLPGKSVIFLRTVYCCPAFFPLCTRCARSLFHPFGWQHQREWFVAMLPLLQHTLL